MGKVHVSIELSAAGAVRLGRRESGWCLVPLPEVAGQQTGEDGLTNEDRAELALVVHDHDMDYHLRYGAPDPLATDPEIWPDTWAALGQLLAAHRGARIAGEATRARVNREREEQEARDAAEREAWQAQRDAEIEAALVSADSTEIVEGSWASTDLAARVAAHNDRAREIIADRKAEQKAVERSERAAMLSTVLDSVDLSRWSAGVMSDDEERLALTDVTWRATDEGLAQYEIMSAAEMEHELYCEESRCDFETATIEIGSRPLSREQWIAYQEITRRFPAENGWTVELRRHRGHCRNCKSTEFRWGVRVSKLVSGVDCRREYELPE